MKVEMRLTRRLYEDVRSDLERPHRYAYERVGFLSVRIGRIGEGGFLVLPSGYFPVDDDNYIPDRGVGARIDAAAIRAVLQRILDSGEGAFHVHLHPYGAGAPPVFSGTDENELMRLIPSFQAAGPKAAQGALLLGPTGCVGAVWLPDQRGRVRISRISVVGYPLTIFSGVQLCRMRSTFASRFSATKRLSGRVP